MLLLFCRNNIEIPEIHEDNFLRPHQAGIPTLLIFSVSPHLLIVNSDVLLDVKL
jgi:hypothetical protein